MFLYLSRKYILNKHNRKCKDKYNKSTNRFFDFKNNKNIKKTPIINRYNSKRKKNNNDDIIGLILIFYGIISTTNSFIRIISIIF